MLPPGQHAVDGFPRFGTHLHLPPPQVPRDPALVLGGATTRSVTLSLDALAALPRTAITADFHCVAGWSATGLRWEGVTMATVYREVVEPVLAGPAAVTHLRFGGLDGYCSVVSVEDALAPDVLLADRLDGRPLGPDHGAPLRLVSPGQYGYVNTKHLASVEALTAAPPAAYGATTALAATGLRLLGFHAHSRARVWEEERGGHLPNRVARPVYRLLTPPIAALSRLGSRPSP